MKFTNLVTVLPFLGMHLLSAKALDISSTTISIGENNKLEWETPAGSGNWHNQTGGTMIWRTGQFAFKFTPSKDGKELFTIKCYGSGVDEEPHQIFNFDLRNEHPYIEGYSDKARIWCPVEEGKAANLPVPSDIDSDKNKP
ncbi:uncharacterized protein I206_105201 [Kwoniella pini CBS 10737]|uniref:Uncharacterized protein n=1 Tax=Kwoniella pini CBS 10737 TaxID=1296096 RepID=A0A1B9I4W5_9TREE|nr:uncharacterized protein I206_03890 [Kwoniella pini CBS 10737]OCF50565.1 hypothetical protein I206_03890 [Kwoniella pini CBS 10737]